MRIVIDGYNLALPAGTGVATYGRNLIVAARALGHDVSVLYGLQNPSKSSNLLNEIAIADPKEMMPPTRSKFKRWIEAFNTAQTIFGTTQATEIHHSGQVISDPSRSVNLNRAWGAQDIYRRSIGLHRKTGLISRVAIPFIDVAHWTYPLPIEATSATNIYTLHDLVPLRLPYTTGDEKRLYLALCQRIAARADHIVTVSEASRRDIVEILGISEDRVSNTYQSVELPPNITNISSDTLSTYIEGLLGVGLREYFLFFGAIEPKKNVLRLIEAYLGSGVRTPLVIVGAPGWGSERDAKTLKALQLLDRNNRLIWLDYLPREMLMMLVAGARATLFPSLYEGFGLPVAESMALGTPVLTSNSSSLVEVSGGAALHVDPYDTNSISNGIVTLDNNPTLRDEFSQRGLIESDKFSRKNYQKRLSDLYKKFS